MSHYIRLKQLLSQYQKAYELGTPIVSDDVYDALYRQLQSLEQNITHNNTHNTRRSCSNDDHSPTQIVGYNMTNRPTHKHFRKLLSLDHEFAIDGIDTFYRRITALLKISSFAVVGQPKIDGVSVGIRYINGQLAYAALRGDGEKGEDITTHMLSLNIPLQFDLCEQIQGELYIENNAFYAAFSKEFSTPRHLVAGSVRLLDSDLFAKRQIRFLVHGFAGYKGQLTSYSAIMHEISQSFDTAPVTICPDIDASKTYWQADHMLPYQADGIVLKLDDMQLWHLLPDSTKHPLHSFAIKPKAKLHTSIVTKIAWSIGRTGLVTPVIHIAPVDIDGVTVSKASMHNVSLFNQLAPRVDDIVLIKRSGDVIPHIEQVIHTGESHSSNASSQIPANCPSCRELLTQEDKYLFCKNNNCKEQIIQHTAYVLQVLEVKGLAYSKLEFLYNADVLKHFTDIFDYHRWTWLTEAKGWGATSYNKISIPTSISFEQFLVCLGIKNLSFNTAKKIGQYAQSIEQLQALDLEQIDGLGLSIAENIRHFLTHSWDIITRLSSKVTIHAVTIVDNRPIAVLTGSFTISKAIFKKQLQALQFHDNVTQRTDVLIYGDKAGTKLKTAQAMQDTGHRIQILDEQQAIALYRNAITTASTF